MRTVHPLLAVTNYRAERAFIAGPGRGRQETTNTRLHSSLKSTPLTSTRSPSGNSYTTSILVIVTSLIVRASLNPAPQGNRHHEQNE